MGPALKRIYVHSFVCLFDTSQIEGVVRVSYLSYLRYLPVPLVSSYVMSFKSMGPGGPQIHLVHSVIICCGMCIRFIIPISTCIWRNGLQRNERDTDHSMTTCKCLNPGLTNCQFELNFQRPYLKVDVIQYFGSIICWVSDVA